MNNKRQSPMLMEMLIVLLFFSVCAALLVGVFGSAYKKSESALVKTEALQLCEGYAELFSAQNISAADYFNSLGWTMTEDGSYQTTQSISKSEVTFIAELKTEPEGFNLSCICLDEELFSLEIYNGRLR